MLYIPTIAPPIRTASYHFTHAHGAKVTYNWTRGRAGVMGSPWALRCGPAGRAPNSCAITRAGSPRQRAKCYIAGRPLSGAMAGSGQGGATSRRALQVLVPLAQDTANLFGLDHDEGAGERLEAAVSSGLAGTNGGAPGTHRPSRRTVLAALRRRSRLAADTEQEDGASRNEIAFGSGIISLDPKTNRDRINAGLVLDFFELYGEAVRQLDEVASPDADLAEACINKAAIMARLGRHEDALADLERAIALEPGRAEAHVWRGEALLSLGRHEEALRAFGAAAGPGGKNAGAHVGMARALLELGRAKDALGALDEAASLEPDSAEERFCRGDALLALGRAKDALGALDAAVGLDPGSADARLGRAHALLALGRAKDALGALDEADRLDPGNAMVLLCRGHALRTLGRYREALADLDGAARLAPALGVPPAPDGHRPAGG